MIKLSVITFLIPMIFGSDIKKPLSYKNFSCQLILIYTFIYYINYMLTRDNNYV